MFKAICYCPKLFVVSIQFFTVNWLTPFVHVPGFSHHDGWQMVGQSWRMVLYSTNGTGRSSRENLSTKWLQISNSSLRSLPIPWRTCPTRLKWKHSPEGSCGSIKAANLLQSIIILALWIPNYICHLTVLPSSSLSLFVKVKFCWLNGIPILPWHSINVPICLCQLYFWKFPVSVWYQGASVIEDLG